MQQHKHSVCMHSFPCSTILVSVIPKLHNIVTKFFVCEIVTVGSELLPSSQVADSEYSKSYKGNCKANQLENKSCIGAAHTARRPGENVQLKHHPSGKTINASWFVLLPVPSYLFFSLFCLNMYESVFNMCTCIFICSLMSHAQVCVNTHV